MPKQTDDVVVRILTGEMTSDMTFAQKVWAITARIPRGRVTTYREVARQLNTKAYQAVGAALGRNPYAPKVPCHRVVGSNGALVGFAGGIPQKQRMLIEEGVEITNGRVDVKRYLCNLSPGR